MADQRPEWAAWLREQFDTHPQIRTNADLSRAGGVKPNGRPIIDPSTITQWLRGRRPSYGLVMSTAIAFGAPLLDAMVAAGYPPPTTRTVGPETQDGAVLRRDPEIDSALRALRRVGEENARNAADLNAALAALARALGQDE